jgi:two-component system sensor histidine kinase KdpD
MWLASQFDMASSAFRMPIAALRGVSTDPHVRPSAVARLLVGPVAIAAVTAVFIGWLPLANATTVALSYLLIVLFVAASSRLWVAIGASVSAMLALNFFFLPPIGSLAISEPQNWVAWITFLAVSLVASHLSSVARVRRYQAIGRRDELARLFDLSRDILMATDGSEPLSSLAARISERFQLGYVAVRLPIDERFDQYEFGDPRTTPGGQHLERALREIQGTGLRPEHRRSDEDGDTSRAASLAPLRFGTHAVGLLGVAGRPLERETLDMLANLVAMAIDRGQLLEGRRQAEVRQRSAELQSALLASLAHDLRTPLTAIRVAASNLTAPWLNEEQRSDQADIVLIEVRRLERLFHNIIQMARIESGVITPAYQWVCPSEITEAARSQVDHSLREHKIALLEDAGRMLVRLDPRLTSAALAHLLENAAQYSPPQSTITVTHEVTAGGLLITVQDEGAGVKTDDLPHLFDPFYRGASLGRHASGTGMGLAITRGLLAAEQGRVWLEERAGAGARFSMFVPAESRPATLPEEP